MSTDIQTEPSKNQLPETAREIARRASEAAQETAKRATATARDVADVVEDAAGDITDATKDAAKSASQTGKDLYQSAAVKAGDTLETSREYVRQNPLPVVLCAIAFGATVGYMLMMARRKPTFSERYADEPMAAVREAILAALAPVTQRVHEGIDSARDGAGKALDRVHSAGRNGHSLSHKIGQIGNNLKFW